MERIEVITSVQRRRRYSGQEKAQFVAMTMQPGSSVSSVARQYGISPSLLFKWKRLMQDGGVTAVEANDQVVSVSDYNALLKKVKQLELHFSLSQINSVKMSNVSHTDSVICYWPILIKKLKVRLI